MPLNEAQKGWLNGLLGKSLPNASTAPSPHTDDVQTIAAPGGPTGTGAGRVTGPIFDAPTPPNSDPNIAAIDDAMRDITGAAATLVGAGLDATPHLQANDALRKALEDALKLKEPARTVSLVAIRAKGAAALKAAQDAVAKGLPPVRERLEKETHDLLSKASDELKKLPDKDAQKVALTSSATDIETQLKAGPKGEGDTELGKMVWIQRLHFLAEGLSRSAAKASKEHIAPKKP